MVCAVQYVSLCQENDQFIHFHQSILVSLIFIKVLLRIMNLEKIVMSCVYHALQSLFLVGLIPFVSGVNFIFSEDVSYHIASSIVCRSAFITAKLANISYVCIHQRRLVMISQKPNIIVHHM